MSEIRYTPNDEPTLGNVIRRHAIPTLTYGNGKPKPISLTRFLGT
jgi:hypothetical protein